MIIVTLAIFVVLIFIHSELRDLSESLQTIADSYEEARELYRGDDDGL